MKWKKVKKNRKKDLIRKFYKKPNNEELDYIIKKLKEGGKRIG
jgi:hypothetical protein